nr:LA27-like protein [Limnephilus flavicornis]
MDRVKVFLFTGLVFVLLSSLSGVKSEQCNPHKSDCPPTKCEDMELPTLVKYLWDIPKGISPAGEAYKKEIIKLAKDVKKRPVEDRTRRSALVLILTLWAVDSYTDLVIPASPSCVFKALIESTLSGSTVEQDKAVDEYLKLCILATNSSVRTGMKGAECPFGEKEDDTVFESCQVSGDSFQNILDQPCSELPPSLKPLIEDLHRSARGVDIGISVGAAGSVTKLSLDIFATLMESDELIQVARLKACPGKIPSECCADRLRKLTVAAENLKAAFVNLQAAQ